MGREWGRFFAGLGSKTVSVLLNSGDGVFGDKVDYATGDSPVAVQAADFNGDGNIDLAICINGGWLAVRINNGDGTFASQQTYSFYGPPVSVTAADFNGDGSVDLATANGSGTVSVLANNGDGTFARGPLSVDEGSGVGVQGMGEDAAAGVVVGRVVMASWPFAEGAKGEDGVLSEAGGDQLSAER
jgi:hypothetical protein